MFVFVCIVISCLVIIDGGITYFGLHHGFTEGNPIVLKTMDMLGEGLGLFVSVIIPLFAIFLTSILFYYKATDGQILFLSCGLIVCIALRSFVIGSW